MIDDLKMKCPYCDEGWSTRAHRIRCEMGILRARLLSTRTMSRVERMWRRALGQAGIEADDSWKAIEAATDEQLDSVRAILSPRIVEPDPGLSRDAAEALAEAVGREFIG